MQAPASNRLLAMLPAHVREQLARDMEPVSLPTGQVLHQQHEPVERSYFPVSGLISIVLTTPEGQSIEAGMVGREGVAGLPLLAAQPSAWKTIVQVPGEALAIDTDVLGQHAAEHPELQMAFLRYMGYLNQMSAQNIACNRFHTIDHRAARWLLMVRDRSDSDDIEITQEFFAQMLGVHRPNVTAVLSSLRNRGLLERTQRGRIRLLDPAGLEAVACECYQRIRAWTEQLSE